MKRQSLQPPEQFFDITASPSAHIDLSDRAAFQKDPLFQHVKGYLLRNRASNDLKRTQVLRPAGARIVPLNTYIATTCKT